MPLNILRIYYQTLSGASIEELKATDVVKQTEWLLTELLKEYHTKEDDLVKAEPDENISILADIDDLLKVQKKHQEMLLKQREKLVDLNNLVQHLEQVYQTREVLHEMFDQVNIEEAEIIKQSSKETSEDIIVSESSEKVDRDVKLDNKSDITDEKNNKKSSGEDIKTRINHAADEL